MRALVLAQDGDRVLTEIDGRPALAYVLKVLQLSRIVEVVVCLGARAKEVREICIDFELIYHFVDCGADCKRGTIASIDTARHELGDGEELILINGETIFETRVVAELLAVTGSAIPVDWGNYDRNAMKVSVNDGYVFRISRDHLRDETYGLAIGVYKIGARDLKQLFSDVRRAIEHHGEGALPVEEMLEREMLCGSFKAVPLRFQRLRWRPVEVSAGAAHTQ